MTTQQGEASHQRHLRYQCGDRVRIIGGHSHGQPGEIVAVDPTQACAYLVKLHGAWYVPYPEHRLAPAPRTARPERERLPGGEWSLAAGQRRSGS